MEEAGAREEEEGEGPQTMDVTPDSSNGFLNKPKVLSIRVSFFDGDASSVPVALFFQLFTKLRSPLPMGDIYNKR